MFPEDQRINSTYEYNKVRNLANKYGNVRHLPTFHAFYIKASDISKPTRLGIVVSNKFHKNAVVRNRARRLFREAIRDSLPELPLGYLIVLHPRQAGLDNGYENIKSDFITFISKDLITA